MAKIQLVYASQEEIPEPLKEYYAESGGKYHLQADGMKTQEDINRVEAAITRERERRVDIQKELDKYKEVDLEKWEKVKDLDPSGKPDADFKERERELLDRFKQKETELSDQIEAEKNKARNYIRETYQRRILSEKFGFTDPRRLSDFMRAINSDDPDFAPLRRTLDTVEVADEGGQFRIVGGEYKDEKGAMEAIERVAGAELAKHYRPAPDNAGGGAGNKGGGGSGGDNPFHKDTRNRTEAGKLIRENPDEARRLAKAAGYSDEMITW